MVGLSLSLLLVVVGLAWRALDDPYVATPGGSAAPTARPGQAALALADLEAAIERGDAAAAAALAPSGDADAADRLRAVVENAEDLGLEGVTLRYVDQDGGTDPTGAWQAVVDVTWQIAGFDPAPARSEVLFALRNVTEPTGDRVAVTAAGAAGGRAPLWLSDDLRVRRTDSRVVAVAGSQRDLARYDRLARLALPVVREVLPEVERRLVVEVPRTAAGLDAALDADEGTYADIAAVTTSPDGEVREAGPLHVLVNPSEMGRLKQVGAQVVMSHEAAHALSDAPMSRAPLWLVEGFADYVALRDVDLPDTEVAAQLADQVQENGLPDDLPGPAELGVGAPYLGASYEAAWLATRELARAGGEDALVELYRSVGAGDDLDAALRDVVGLSRDELVARWRDAMRSLAEQADAA
ncbi:hypothetical protein BKA08_002689 [Nocardioides marinisabuli]|uniref:Peptidase MA-like domain-containing protein n=1 Tax=Nocardioides marinisabuli TaxID=419476 RepID=A0A7Y9F303_9ACTN|nr:hypothetical protein [Nocardioides marinisabuli]NYD58451.1 hypothetical protein [Nocardioides marinisabuli]